MLSFYITVFLFIFIVLNLICKYNGFSLWKLLIYIKEELLITLGASSSEPALPNIMLKLEAAGCDKTVVGLLIPAGYSFNLDGTTLYLSLASIFVAQACGVHLSFGNQVFIVFTLMLTSKGVAGVPRASFVILLGTIASFSYLGLKEWPLYIILGIDALMDMARTSINVMGNCVASAVVARWEGELDDTKMNQENLFEHTQ